MRRDRVLLRKADPSTSNFEGRNVASRKLRSAIGADLSGLLGLLR